MSWVWRWEEGSRGRVLLCILYGWSMLMYSRKQHSIVKQIIQTKNKFKTFGLSTKILHCLYTVWTFENHNTRPHNCLSISFTSLLCCYPPQSPLWKCIYFDSLLFFFHIFARFQLKYVWHITLCKFKVHSINSTRLYINNLMDIVTILRTSIWLHNYLFFSNGTPEI